MNTVKVDKIIQYALAVAADEDDYRLRELGPIHLIKYVYLADLAYAERHTGETFTGTHWIFYNFGPWSPQVHGRLETACSAVRARKRSIPSNFKDDDFVRWSLPDHDIKSRLEEDLPLAITSNLKKWVHQYGPDTSALLHMVYKTYPMLKAAPNEALDFAPLPVHAEVPGQVESSSLTVKQQKKQKVIFKETCEKLQGKLAQMKQAHTAKPKNKYPFGKPRYDEVYFQGMEWLDSLAGPDVKKTTGEAVFSSDIWKSKARFDPDLPEY
jgi:hypothetical protein